MKWIDGSCIDIKKFSGAELCEKLSHELWDYERSQWLEYDDFIQTAMFLIDFDTELVMEGIFTCFENSTGHYVPHIIKAFRTIGDHKDAEILSEICRLISPNLMRAEFLSKGYSEYYILTFSDDNELSEEVMDEIERLESQLYLNTGLDMWQLLYDYLDRRISEL
ncbi:MAG: DMP19 family protein [Ruminococcus flavefaciens]|nr:DMP19 family protein [Ruminococcus flavefaciens]